MTERPFFASKVRLGRTGAEEIFSLGPLNEYERSVQTEHNLIPCSIYMMSSKLGNIINRAGLEKAKKELAASIEKGVSFVRK